jgi:hypothetical protein
MQITFKRFESELARQGKSAATRRGLLWSNNASILQSAVIVSQNGIVAHSFRADEVFTPYGALNNNKLLSKVSILVWKHTLTCQNRYYSARDKIGALRRQLALLESGRAEDD